MIKSMTAFGSGQASFEAVTWCVELRTVNSRYLDLHLRLPRGMSGLEDRVSKMIGARLTRGRVNLNLGSRGTSDTSVKLSLNRPLFMQYRGVLQEMRQELGSKEPMNLDHFVGNKDLILVEEETPDQEELWSQIEPALTAALDEAEAMRTVEGQTLHQDFTSRMDRLVDMYEQAAAYAPQVVESYRRRLSDRLAKLLDSDQPDPQRIALEVAVIADKCDVTEEIVRARSHVEQFRTYLEADEPVGRKLDFLMQELNREANTMGSKMPDAQAAQLIVEIKAELEKIREQVQNIE